MPLFLFSLFIFLITERFVRFVLGVVIFKFFFFKCSAAVELALQQVHPGGHAGQPRSLISSVPQDPRRIDWALVRFVTGDHGDWDTAQAC